MTFSWWYPTITLTYVELPSMGSVAFTLEELSCTSKRCIHGQYYHILLALQNFQFSSRTHTAHTTVSWPHPKQWIIIHASDLMMIARQRIYSLNHHKGNGSTENTQPHLLYKDNSENMLNLTHTLTKYIWQTFISSMSSICTMTIMRGCNVQTNECDLQAKTYPTICTHHKLRNNNKNKIPVFPECIFNKWQNMMYKTSQAHSHEKMW